MTDHVQNRREGFVANHIICSGIDDDRECNRLRNLSSSCACRRTPAAFAQSCSKRVLHVFEAVFVDQRTNQIASSGPIRTLE
jgi:hypothetical protein